MNKKKSKKRKKSIVRILVIACFFVYVGYTLITQQIDINNQKAKIKATDEQILVAENEEKALEEEKKLVGTPEYIERYARSVLGYAAPDEIVFIDSTVGN